MWIELSNSDTIKFELVRYDDGIKQGKAEMYLVNGDVAMGTYKDDKKHGGWKYYKKDDRSVYQIEYYTEGYISRIEFIENGAIKRQAITDPPF